MTDAYRNPGKARSPAMESLAADADGRHVSAIHPEVAAHRRAAALGMLARRDAFGIVGMIIGFSGALVAIMGLRGHWNEVAISGAIGIAIGVALYVTGGRIHQRRLDLALGGALAWQDTHPFPVTGLSGFLVADLTTATVHLRGPIDIDTLAGAAKAVDPQIAVSSVGGMAYELVIPSPKQHGDVAALKRVFEHIVTPLHGDVGIERVELGASERRQTSAPTTAPEAKRRSPALEALAASARTRPASRALPPAVVRRKLLCALDVPTGRGLLYTLAVVAIGVGVLFIVGAAVTRWLGAGIAGSVTLLIGSYVVYATHDAVASQLRFRQDAARSWAASCAFPVTGLDAYLAADRSTIALHLAAALDATTIAAAVKAVDPAIATRSVDARTFELVVPPRDIGIHGSCGDLAALQRIVDRVVTPLHEDVGVERVELTGSG